MQIVAENASENRVKVTNFSSSNASELSEAITDVTAGIPSHEFDIDPVNNNKVEIVGDSNVVVIDNLLAEEKVLDYKE